MKQLNGQSLVIFGPEACGKTRYSMKLAEAFGLSNVIGGERLPVPTKLQKDTLYICVECPHPKYPSMSFKLAMQQAGINLPTDTHFHWTTP